MYLLDAGRKSYLEFLRNLTPQIVIVSMLLVSGSKLDWSHFSYSNPAGNLLFWGLLAIFVSAAWANGAEFLSNALDNIHQRKKSLDHGLDSVPLWEKITHAFRHHTGLFFEVLIAMLIVELALVSVVVIGLANGHNLLRLISQ